MAISPCVGHINDEHLELVSHGTPDFPIACYNDDLKALSVEWHWHPEFEFIIVSEGESLITAGSQKYIVEKGEGIFINSEVLHSGFLGNTENCLYHSFVFHPILVGGNFNSIYWTQYILPLLENKSFECLHLTQTIPWQKELLDILESAWQAMANETPYFEFVVREAVSRLIYTLTTRHIISQSTPSSKSLRDGERMKVMLQYVSEHFSDEITVHNLANCAMISESECLRCFHSTIGTTPIQYVKQFRIRKAATLLTSTSLKVADIGTLCGFQDISYFVKSFKQTYGCTPTNYRKTFVSPSSSD